MAAPRDYSLQEITNMWNSASANGTGPLSNTVFSRPQNAATYDSAAATAMQLQAGMINKYINSMGAYVETKRATALSSALGIGSMGPKGFELLKGYDRNFAMDIIGHSGGYEAMGAMLGNANAIANARGGTMGGILSPGQYARNMSMAYGLTARAYAGNFKANGSVDVEQTGGLSLPEAALVSNGILSNKGNYQAWAEKWRNATSEERKREGLRADGKDVEMFASGKAVPASALDSFSKGMKDLAKEVNNDISAIAKLTGDVGEAIKALQQASGGKAFSAGAKAREARSEAVKHALNMRAMAADAGMNPQEMYARASGFGDAYRSMNGIDKLFDTSGDADYFGKVGAAAYAMWKKANPNATGEESARRSAAINEASNDYAHGDMAKMTKMASYMKNLGYDVDEEKMKKLASSGDAEQMHNYLSSFFDNKQDFEELKNDDLFIKEAEENGDSALRRELDRRAIDAGEIETSRQGGKNRMNTRIKAFKSGLTAGKDAETRRSLNRQMVKMETDAFSRLDLLEQAGVSKEKAQEIREQAVKNGWGQDDIIKAATEAGGDSTMLTESGMKAFSESLATLAKQNGKAGLGNALKKFTGEVYKDVTDDQLKNAAKDELVEEKNKGLSDVALKVRTSTGKEKEAANAKLKSLRDDALAGRNGLSFTSENYVKQLLKDSGLKDEDVDKYYAKFKDDYLVQTNDANAAMNMLSKDMEKNNVKGFDSRRFNSTASREKAFEKTEVAETAASVYRQFVKAANVGEDDASANEAAFMKYVRARSGGSDSVENVIKAGLTQTLGKDKGLAEVIKNSTDGMIQRAHDDAKVHSMAGVSYTRESVSDAEATERVKRDRGRLVIKARGGVDKTTAAASAAPGGRDAMNRKQISGGSLTGAAEALENPNAKLLEQADQEQAKLTNEVLGDFGSVGERKAYAKIGGDSELKFIDKAVGSFMDDTAVQTNLNLRVNNNVSRQRVAQAIKAVLEDNKGASRSKLLSALDAKIPGAKRFFDTDAFNKKNLGVTRLAALTAWSERYANVSDEDKTGDMKAAKAALISVEGGHRQQKDDLKAKQKRYKELLTQHGTWKNLWNVFGDKDLKREAGLLEEEKEKDEKKEGGGGGGGTDTGEIERYLGEIKRVLEHMDNHLK